MRRNAIAVTISALGVAVGAFSLKVARDDPGYWFAGTSTVAGVALLAAGWALIGCGLVFWVRRPGNRFGPLLAAAGFAWFLPEWNNPGIGSSFAFTVGLCLYAACPPLAGHAVLAYPSGRLGSYPERCAVGGAYAGGLLVIGVLPALFFDPQAHGCNECPSNLLAVSDKEALSSDLNRAGVYLGLAWALALAALALVRLARASIWARAVFASGPRTSYLSPPGSRPHSTLASFRTARLSDGFGLGWPWLSLSSRWESRGAGFGAAEHGRPWRSSSWISPSRLQWVA